MDNTQRVESLTGLQEIVELSMGLKQITTATYSTERAGIIFKHVVVVQTTITVPTDRLLVSDEGVRVLDSRE
jgi:hypothetical protein